MNWKLINMGGLWPNWLITNLWPNWSCRVVSSLINCNLKIATTNIYNFLKWATTKLGFCVYLPLPPNPFFPFLKIMIYAKSPRQLLLPLWSLLSSRWTDKSLSSRRRISGEKDQCIVIFWLHGSIQWCFEEVKANFSTVIMGHCMSSIGGYKY